LWFELPDTAVVADAADKSPVTLKTEQR
jgi:hypothetical protein